MKAMAMAWYRIEDWPRWVALCRDFDPDPERWRAKMAKARLALNAHGVTLAQVDLDPDEFESWANQHAGGRFDTHARALCAAAKMAMAIECRASPGEGTE